MAAPRKGKAKVKITSTGKKVLGIKRRLSKKKQNNPNTPNNLSRKRWKCVGAKSKK